MDGLLKYNSGARFGAHVISLPPSCALQPISLHKIKKEMLNICNTMYLWSKIIKLIS